MQTRIALLASTAVAAFALAAPASAAATWYASLTGGANWLNDNDFVVLSPAPTDTFAISADSDTGWVIAGAVGLNLNQWMQGLRLEAEVSYRTNEVDGDWVTNNNVDAPDSGPLNYDHSAVAVMANVWWDFDVGGFRPYVGGGIGWADVEAEGSYVNGDVVPFSFSDDGFAWQLGAGVNFQVSPSVLLGVGYRYFEAPDVTILPPDIVNNQASGDLEYQSHAAVVTLTFGM